MSDSLLIGVLRSDALVFVAAFGAIAVVFLVVLFGLLWLGSRGTSGPSDGGG